MVAVADRQPIEQTIHTVSVRRLGVVDTSIVRHVDGNDRNEWGGVWFALFVRLPGDDEWKLIGRRRTKVELLSLAETLDPRHVDGKCFRDSRSNGR